jgi:type II secretory pathway pseudopilin PulG
MRTPSHIWGQQAHRLLHGEPAVTNVQLRAGYSYIELMVVLLICSILGAAAVPQYTNALFQFRVDAASKRIAADIAFAQRQALLRSSNQSIVFTPANGSGTPNSYSMPTVQYVDFAAAGAVVRIDQAPYQATIASASFGAGATLSFDRYGTPSSGGTVVVQASGYSKTVTVNADTGKATVP